MDAAAGFFAANSALDRASPKSLRRPRPHPHAALLRGVEGVKNPLEMFRVNARPRVAHCHVDAICLVLLGADHQLPRPRLNRARCIDRIQDQVQDDLLQLNTIPLDGKQSVRKRVWTETAFLVIALCANTMPLPSSVAS